MRSAKNGTIVTSLRYSWKCSASGGRGRKKNGESLVRDLEPTNMALLGRMKSGSAGAWSEFDQFHRGLIIHWARRFGCPFDTAEDVCQETMVALLRVLPTFEHNGRRGGFHAFLKMLVQRRSADALRRLGREIHGKMWSEAVPPESGTKDGASHIERSASGMVPATLAEPSADLMDDTAWISTLLARACARAFENLDSQIYRSFCLYVIDGVGVDETTHRVGVDRAATVYQHKSRMFRAIRDAMCDILAELDDPELRQGASQLKGSEVIRMISQLVAGNSDVRLTAHSETQSLDRLVLARYALKLCASRDDGPWLVLPGTERVISLEEVDTLSIGSSDADVWLDAPGVSGRHCEIRQTDTGWLVADAGSRNGVMVNGRRTQQRPLCDGDMLTLGTEHLVFLDADKMPL